MRAKAACLLLLAAAVRAEIGLDPTRRWAFPVEERRLFTRSRAAAPSLRRPLQETTQATKPAATGGSSALAASPRRLRRPQGDAVRIMRRLWADFAAAAVSAFAVSPIITIVDKSIVLTANGASTLGASVRAGVHTMVTQPAQFVWGREFMWVWALYGVTFLAANTIATACEELQASSTVPKFLGTTAVNMPSCIAKDAAFARMFGSARLGAVPALSYALFTVRDCITIAAGFTLPEGMSEKMRESMGWGKEVTDNVAQLMCPGLMQFVTTPLHLLGLDLYNNPTAAMTTRSAQLAKHYTSSVALRFGRVGAAFGIGGVANRLVREALQPERKDAEAAKAAAAGM